MSFSKTVTLWLWALMFGGIGWCIIVMNFTIVYVWVVKRRHSSWIPLIGGIAAMVGMAFCPVPQVRRLAWVPLVIDVVYCVTVLVVGLLMEWRKRRKI